MKFRIVFFLIVCSISSWAQGAHTQLIDLTKNEANVLADELGLTFDQTKLLTSIYVKHAMATEDLIVSVDPEINLLKEIKGLEKGRDKEIKGLLSSDEYQLYVHKRKQADDRSNSEFDSLLIHLNNPEFNNAVIKYFDEDVSPYLVYYHQTYFRPALKQKHYFKINQQRVKISEIQYKIDSMKLENGEDFIISEEVESELDNSFKELKRLRKKYKDELDYINVALSQVKREWDLAYVNMIKAHYKDDVYQKIDNYNKLLNAYGVEYLVGGFSLLLFDIYYPRSYVESRDLLIKMINQ